MARPPGERVRVSRASAADVVAAVDVPDLDNAPPSRSFADLFPPASERMDVVLAIPIIRPGSANVSKSTGQPDFLARYVPASVQVPDENTGENPHEVPLAAKNLRLLFGEDDPQLARISADFMRLDLLQLALDELGAEAEGRGVQQTLLLFVNQVMGKVNVLIRKFLGHRDPLGRFGVTNLLVEVEELIVLAERLLESNAEITPAEASGPGGAAMADFIARMNRDYGVAILKGDPKAIAGGGAG